MHVLSTECSIIVDIETAFVWVIFKVWSWTSLIVRDTVYCLSAKTEDYDIFISRCFNQSWKWVNFWNPTQPTEVFFTWNPTHPVIDTRQFKKTIQ